MGRNFKKLQNGSYGEVVDVWAQDPFTSSIFMDFSHFNYSGSTSDRFS